MALTEKEKLIRKQLYNKKYYESPKGQASHERFKDSSKRKEWLNSKKGKLSMANSSLKYAKKHNLEWAEQQANKWIFKINNYE